MPNHVKAFRETRAAIKIQRTARLMINVGAARPRETGMMDVVLTTDAMRGGHINDDRTDRVLKRMSIHEERRGSATPTEEQRIKAILEQEDFSPSRFCSPEVAEMMRIEHDRTHGLELTAWEGMADWNVPLDGKAIERRLQLLRPQQRRRNDSRGGRYLAQRPSTASASGLGARAARSLRQRPSTAPARLSATKGVELRAIFCVVLVCVGAGRFSKGANSTSFFIRSSAIGAARRARMV